MCKVPKCCTNTMQLNLGVLVEIAKVLKSDTKDFIAAKITM